MDDKLLALFRANLEKSSNVYVIPFKSTSHPGLCTVTSSRKELLLCGRECKDSVAYYEVSRQMCFN